MRRLRWEAYATALNPEGSGSCTIAWPDKKAAHCARGSAWLIKNRSLACAPLHFPTDILPLSRKLARVSVPATTIIPSQVAG